MGRAAAGVLPALSGTVSLGGMTRAGTSRASSPSSWSRAGRDDFALVTERDTGHPFGGWWFGSPPGTPGPGSAPSTGGVTGACCIPPGAGVRWRQPGELVAVAQTEADERLSRIETQWTAVFRAHDAAADGAKVARDRLMLRYSGAVYRYLLGALRKPDGELL